MASLNSTDWVSSLSSYFDAFAWNLLPARVQSLIGTHVTPLLKVSAAHPQATPFNRLTLLLTDYAALSYTSIAATLLALIYLLYSMSSYGRSALDDRRGRRSPYTSAAGDRSITEIEYEYLGPEYSEPPRPRRQDNTPIFSNNRPSVGSKYDYDNGEGPDIILLRHMNTQYQLQFKPFAISDGILRIADIRTFAAETLGAPDPSRLRLLYKGKQLKDDKRPAKEYGLKQQSEIMVVVSETPPSRPNSDSETEESSSAVSYSSKKGGTQVHKPKAKRSKDNLTPPGVEQVPLTRRRSRRGSRAPSPQSCPPQSPPSQPTPPQSPPSTSPRSGNAQAKVDQLASAFHTQWVPKCVQFLLHPPDRETRGQEHRKLSESIFAQILLKADDIDLEGDVQARNSRRKLIDEVNEMLKRLDAVAKGYES